MGSRRNEERISRNVGLLISNLVRCPEVATVKYDPRQQTVRFSLLLAGSQDEAQWQVTREKFRETLEVYHLLQMRQATVVEVVGAEYGEMRSIAITRDARTCTPEEIYTIIEFFRERYTGQLVTDVLEFTGEDDMLAQDEMIEEILADLEEDKAGHNLIAIREDGRLMVFAK
ncbi:MAG: hypothetical protein ACM3XM_21460 [Mycobacterium leprae]